MSVQPDHELEVLEDDQNVPPRPEEQIADVRDAPAAPGDSTDDAAPNSA
ncbi:hypothetical protein [Intrasporangium sp. YIM S08009]|nr:hypothetical protein [Intrasporangium sp. YIM S08009]